MTDNSDAQLVQQCLDGNTKGFEALVEKYQKAIFNGALKMVRDYQDAQDIAQSVFVKAYEKLGNFDPRYKFFSWLYRIMVNETMNFISKQKNHADLNSSIESPDNTPEENLREKQLSELIQESLMMLRPEYRAVIVLRHFADLSYRELGFVFDLPVKTVKSRLFESRKRLCCMLMEKGVTVRE